MKGVLIFAAGAAVGIAAGAVGVVCTTGSLSGLLYGLLDKAASKFETEEQVMQRMQREVASERLRQTYLTNESLLTNFRR